MQTDPLRVTSRTTSTCFFNVIVAAVNVPVQPSSHSFPMYIFAHDWRWWKMCAVYDLVDSKGIR